jgi:lipooligosaccharide transport system permease protein
MMATPAQLEDIVAGELAWASARAMIVGTIVLLVILAFGLVASPWALLVPLAAGLSALAFAVLGLSYTSRARHMDQLTFLFTLGVTPMFLFSGVFFPVDKLPSPLSWIVQISPLYHVVEVMRALILGTVSAATIVHALVILLLVLVAWGLPTVLIRRRVNT